MTLSDELLPCPFCGERPSAGYTGNICIIECHSPACWGPAMRHFAVPEEAIAAWNRRASPHGEAGVTIKPLEWRETAWLDGVNTRREPFCWQGEWPGDRWRIEAWGGDFTVRYYDGNQQGENILGTFATLAEAKSAAHADFEARIRSALLPTPSVETGGRQSITEALRMMNCPRPCNHRPDEFTVGECVDAGECGCVAGNGLSASPSVETGRVTDWHERVAAVAPEHRYLGGEDVHQLIRDMLAALSASPGLIRNESAGFYEFVSEDVPTTTGPVRAANVEPILRMGKPRGEVIGFRVWDASPGSSAGAATDDQRLAAAAAIRALFERCQARGTTPGTFAIVSAVIDALASAPPQREGLEEASVVVNALGRAADFLLGVSTQTGTTSEYRDKALAARFAVISAIRALTGKGGE